VGWDVRLVVIESPFAGDVERNTRYARACLLDCYQRGEAPIASHLLGPQVLDDNDPEQRRMGIEAGLAWAECADASAFYIDLGWSNGMKAALTRVGTREVEYRTLAAEVMERVLKP